MQQEKPNQTFEQLQMSEVRENTPDQLIKSPTEPQTQPSVDNSMKFNIRRCMFLIFMVISSSILLSQINAQSDDLPVVEPDAFQFYVYCPYSYINKIKPLQPFERLSAIEEQSISQDSSDKDELRRRLRLLTEYSYNIELKDPVKGYDWNNTYLVQIDSTQGGKLYYCGLVTHYLTTCDEAVEVKCSSPGPMFDLKVNHLTDIIWINNLDPKYFPSVSGGSSCMEKPNAAHCTLYSKPPQSAQMTYVDPTDKHSTHVVTSPVQISPTNWPASTHVHGAEVRPTFDGNPLSWIDNSGNRGVGAFSLSDKCYYDSFDQNDEKHNHYMPPQIIVKNKLNNLILPNVKISRYPNIQNPGNLWYHDHAMRLTLYNVQYGLAGNYILRDDIVTSEIGVARSNQKLIMMTTNAWRTSQSLDLQSNTVYRFRFLNNNYTGSGVYNISFVEGRCSYLSPKIPFTIIGADSSLFHEGIEGQTSFVVTQAERIQLLIQFSQDIGSYSICTSDQLQPPKPVAKRQTESQSHVQHLSSYSTFVAQKNKIKARTQNLNTRKSINNVKLSVPFVDFSDKGDLVAVKRMRPLTRPNNIFAINGRESFHEGKSENPTIGTYEDWYIINTFSSGHPIHIHLINFQVVKTLSLRLVSSCTLYELQFIAQAILKGSSFMTNTSIFPNQSDYRFINYTALCLYKTEVYASQGFKDLSNQVNVEDQVDPQTKVSGIDVEKALDQYDRDLFAKLGITIAAGQGHRYYTAEKPISKPYYRRWKDTAFVQKYEVSVLRLRWAKSAYVDGSNEPYFHVPIDQLRQYPGFVYHCHILFHQDNEMMRPIMLQLPKDAKLDPTTPCNQGPDYSWEAKVKCINEVQCKKP